MAGSAVAPASARIHPLICCRRLRGASAPLASTRFPPSRVIRSLRIEFSISNRSQRAELLIASAHKRETHKGAARKNTFRPLLSADAKMRSSLLSLFHGRLRSNSRSSAATSLASILNRKQPTMIFPFLPRSAAIQRCSGTRVPLRLAIRFTCTAASATHSPFLSFVSLFHF